MISDSTTRPGSIYGGVTGVRLAVESFTLGEGVELRQTYCHLFSTNMTAFERPGPDGHHPAPWKAARGGWGHDIEVEICAPAESPLGSSFDATETIWWIVALLRLARFPFLSVPVLSDQPFRKIPQSSVEPVLTPFETEGRLFGVPGSEDPTLDTATLTWVADNWLKAGQLLNSDPKFYSAFRAFDSATVRGRASASMLALWGGLEQLFAPSAGELRFRVSALLASFLEAPGASRLALYKRVLKLYNERSVAAHTAKDVEMGPLMETYVLMRNALVRMIDEGQVPQQSELESLLFCASPNSDSSTTP
ncbi:hypothetical protein Pla108_21750 [Botrimarina colliarenosi]|uniref:Apea-like HEPN domain-containing protein n=1 Tax=Botrimarina colliarenosi TaxID=2528001 RepID=A0A5C6AF15_9BACT|nr:hypothetical protein Pla108_21750 [Botrimarina colliarenosi]